VLQTVGDDVTASVYGVSAIKQISNKIQQCTNNGDFDSGVGRAWWILENNSIWSSIRAFGVFHHQQSLIIGRLHTVTQ